MDNKFMPPPPAGIRNNMPPPPPPKREVPKETQVEENASTVPNAEKIEENASVVTNEPTFILPPRDLPPRFNDVAKQETQDLNQANAITESEKKTDLSENEEKKKSKIDLKTVLYWGGFGVSIALIILFVYLLLI